MPTDRAPAPASSGAPCPFCPPEAARVFYHGDQVLALWDAFPVAPGHALVIPRRHVATWFEATPEEQAELLRTLDIARAAIEARHRPDGYNIGINVGEAAGQTVFHLHLHIIPRYAGDVPDPRGGVRHVIPGRGNYLLKPGGDGAPGVPALHAADDVVHTPTLIRGGEADPLLPHLLAHLDRAVVVDIAAAFTLESGVRLVEEHLRDLLDRGGRARILTGDYLGVTEPAALLRLLDLQGRIELRIFESAGTSFHPKAYLLTLRDGDGVAYVGSSNLTATALRRGIEWNYRVLTTRDRNGYDDVVRAFEALWNHPRARPLDVAWVHGYRERLLARGAQEEMPVEPGAPGDPALPADPAAAAPPLPAPPPESGLESEPVGPPPEPHAVQKEALAALEATRAAGHGAALVVLATGLGKTWLSAFDSDRPEFRRILFVAHREEILTQALTTFRTIRPYANLGYYTGRERAPEADVLFASIQTLGRERHLQRFDPREFDYIIVDEFHHAAAQSYRRVLDYFEPAFLLGLTATPDRTDGRDLLALCEHNLVYRCDLAEGIRRGLLSPFAYYGVPDDVDYSQIPWRSTRFDEEALTAAVATQARARNALEQYRRLGGIRTLGFCVSKRHADFMAEFFRAAGVRAVAVHSGEGSAPRARSLEELEAGELDVVFAVDIFNEGVDLPAIDTILMLRPTESRILWLQQFGRGLRHRPGKTLQVIDYIGNHRVFLTKTRALFDLGSGDRAVAYALEQLEAGVMELPPGCSVTYELEAVEILRGLLRAPSGQGDRLRAYYEEYRIAHGTRPRAMEVFDDGFDPRSARTGYGSWLDFVHAMGDLTPEQVETRERVGGFLAGLETTGMTKSYKMLVLQAMLAEDALPGRIGIEQLVERFGELARRDAVLRTELGEAVEDAAALGGGSSPDQTRALRDLIVRNPIAAWTGAGALGETRYFTFSGRELSTTFAVPDELRVPLQELVRELVEWRLGVYLSRTAGARGADRIVCRVSHTGERPILFLPDRSRNPGIPEGWRDVMIEGEEYQANFVKIAVNVVTRVGSSENVLPEILRGWFGEEAGRPGRGEEVVFEWNGGVYGLRMC